MKALGQSVGAAWTQAEATGQNPLGSEVVTGQLARALLPKSLYRAQQSYADAAINSSGSIYPSLKGMTPPERILYSLGFNPNKVQLGFKKGNELWEDAMEHKAAIAGMGAAWAEAQLAGDQVTMDAIMTEATVKGYDMSRIMRSASTRMKKAQVDMFERNFDKAKVYRLRELGILSEQVE